MRFYLDFEFNGFKGALITMALLREDNTMMYVGFRDNANVPLDPWVTENVVPHINAAPIQPTWLTTEQIQAALVKFFDGDRLITITTDWPDDIAYFCGLLLTGPGTAIASSEVMPRITFEMERVDSYPTEVKDAVQHCAYWDVLALRHKLQFPSGQPIDQSAPIQFSPVDGNPLADKTFHTAAKIRKDFPNVVWFFNPWTGKQRDHTEFETDPSGLQIRP